MRLTLLEPSPFPYPLLGKEARKAIAISAGIAAGAAYFLYKTLQASTVERFKMAKRLPFFGIALEIEGGKQLARALERLAPYLCRG